MKAFISSRSCSVLIPVLTWHEIRSSHFTEIWFHFISWKNFWFHFTRKSSYSDSVLSHLMISQFHSARESFCSNSVSSHLMKDWSHPMKMWSHPGPVSSHLMKDRSHPTGMWSHPDLVSSYLTEAWSHPSPGLGSGRDEISWSQLSNTDYMMQKEQRVLSSSIINVLLSHILTMLLN